MKLALIIERFDPTLGGSEKSTAQIASELICRGHDVTVITAYCPDTLNLSGINVKRMTAFRHMGISKIWRFTRWAKRKIQQGQYDVTISITSLISADIMQPRTIVRENLLINHTRRTNGKHTLLSRITQPLSIRRQIRLRLEKTAFTNPNIKHFVAISKYVANQLHKHYNINGNTVTIIPNAAVISPMADDERYHNRQAVRQGFDIDNSSTTFIFPAIDPWRKGAVPLFKAVQQLKKKNLDFNVLIVGCQDYKLHRLASKMKIDKHLRFLGLTNEIEKAFSASDVTVLPTYYDPASKVIIESLMMGIPAISSAFNGASDFINGANGSPRGRVVDNPDDIQGLTQAMLELADPQIRQVCVDACAGLDEQLCMSRHVDRLEKVFQKIVTA